MPMRGIVVPDVNILVVDDRPSDRLAVETILADPFYHVVAAATGREALRRVLERDYAVILLDVVLPDMEGFEVAEIVKQRERSRDTPIIFMTAGRDSIYRGYSVGAVDYLVKPIDEDVLRAKVGIFVELYRKDQRIKQQAEALVEAHRQARDLELAELKQASEKRYRDLAEAILPVVFTAGPDGAVQYFNHRWHDYTGQSVDAALGWGWMAAIHPDDSRAREEPWRQALATGGIYEAECRIRDRDGGFRWHLCRAVPERAGDRVVGWLGTYTDCDDLKRAHAATEESRRRLELLAEMSAVLTSTLDDRDALDRAARLAVPRLADGCVVDVMGERDQAREPAEEALVIVHADADLQPRLRDMRARFGPAWLSDVHATGRAELIRKVTDDAVRALARDDEHGRLLAGLGLESALVLPLIVRDRVLGSLTFLSTSAGRRYGELDLDIARDLAQRAAIAIDNARLYREARRAVAARDEFLSIASHELRTPLTSLQLQLQTLERQVARGDASQVAVKISTTVRQTRRLDKLIANLLDVSRVLAARLTLEIESVDIAQLARDVVERFAEEAGRAGCTLAVTGAASVAGRADRLRLEQVLTNLVANAIKYAPGPIEVAVEARSGRAVVRVADRGPGIPAAHQARIFERFERATGGMEHRSGLGLGLYITRHIAEAHGGTIAVDSGPGGTTFTVELPIG